VKPWSWIGVSLVADVACTGCLQGLVEAIWVRHVLCSAS
jgi:hypothetical protein